MFAYKYLIVYFFLISLCLMGCQENIRDRAEREAKEFTLKNCPTPAYNDCITDSLVYDKKSDTHYTYVRFTGDNDNSEAINSHKDEIREAIRKSLLADAKLKPFIEEGFNFEYVCRSYSCPDSVILHLRFTAKELNK